MTGIELACWLIVNAEDRPITLLAPPYGGQIPVEVTSVRISDAAFIPTGAIVGRNDGGVVVIVAEHGMQ